MPLPPPGPPQITPPCNPNVGPTTGGTQVSVFGSNFTNPQVTSVTFDGIPATFFLDGDGHLVCVAPKHPAPNGIQISVQNSFGSANTPFTYQAPAVPIVSSLSPAFGPTIGGTQVMINGSNFINVGAVKVAGIVSPYYSVQGPNQIIIETPPNGVSGAVNVEVDAQAGNSVACPGSTFSYVICAPTLQSLDPASGPSSGGTSVDLYGSNFTNDCQVSFGGTSAVSVVFNSSTWLTAVTPYHVAGSAPVTVSNTAGTSNPQMFQYT